VAVDNITGTLRLKAESAQPYSAQSASFGLVLTPLCHTDDS